MVVGANAQSRMSEYRWHGSGIPLAEGSACFFSHGHLYILPTRDQCFIFSGRPFPQLLALERHVLKDIRWGSCLENYDALVPIYGIWQHRLLWHSYQQGAHVSHALTGRAALFQQLRGIWRSLANNDAKTTSQSIARLKSNPSGSLPICPSYPRCGCR